jgi:predicted lipid-binding transport protein (Tim44 family)
VPAVHENFSLVVLGIVLVSLLPIAWEMYAAKREAAGAARKGQATDSAAAAAKAAAAKAAAAATTPPAAAAAVAASAPPRQPPAVDAAAAVAVAQAKLQMRLRENEAGFKDPLESARVKDVCDDDPGSAECKVYDD